MNQIELLGRLVRAPELRHTQSSVPVASFTLAVDRPRSKDKEKQTDFIDIVAWKGRAEFVSSYFRKGQMCAVTGRLQIRDWTDKDGNKRRSAEIVADNIYFTESKKNREGGGDASNTQHCSDADVNSNDFEELDECGPLLF
jgi:single-strand DNA-binding protein